MQMGVAGTGMKSLRASFGWKENCTEAHDLKSEIWLERREGRETGYYSLAFRQQQRLPQGTSLSL